MDAVDDGGFFVALLGRANLPPGQCVALLEAINERRESCTAAG